MTVSERVIVMLGSDNGVLVRRYGPDDYRVVYVDNYAPGTNPRSSAPNGGGPQVYRSLQIEQLSWIINSQRWLALAEDEFSGGKYAGFLYSINTGRTWQRSDGGGAPGDPPPMDSANLAIGLNAETSPVNEQGVIWDLAGSILSPGSRAWYTSTDYGLTWAEQYVDTNPGGTTWWASDGYLWGIHVFMSLAGSPTVLYRIHQVTGVTTTFTFPWPSGLGSSNSWAISSYYGSRRLFVWAWTPSGMTHYLNIDVADPNVPVGTWVAYTVFPGLSGTKNMIGFIPVTSQKIVAVANNLTFSSSPPNTGAVYYSSDGGFTWSRVIDYTPKLSYIAAAGSFGVFEETPRLSSDGHNVCVSAVPPDVFISTDEGATWTNETMSLGIFSGLARAPTHFLSTAITGPGGTQPPFTSEGTRRLPQATLIGAT
jgi:hypothetical protein